MGAGYGRDLVKLFRKNDCIFIRNGKGDHQIWFSPKTNRQVTLDFSTTDKNTANGTLKQAGINHKF
jgi:hypothetical protein